MESEKDLVCGCEGNGRKCRKKHRDIIIVYKRENIRKHKYAHGARRLNPNDQHCLRFCFQVCEAFLYGGGTEKWHSQHQVPYAFKGNNWVGYDNVRSLKAKVHLCC